MTPTIWLVPLTSLKRCRTVSTWRHNSTATKHNINTELMAPRKIGKYGPVSHIPKVSRTVSLGAHHCLKRAFCRTVAAPDLKNPPPKGQWLCFSDWQQYRGEESHREHHINNLTLHCYKYNIHTNADIFWSLKHIPVFLNVHTGDVSKGLQSFKWLSTWPLKQFNELNLFREYSFLIWTTNNNKKPRDRPRKTHKTWPFPYSYFVSPVKTKGMQPNASAVIVCRQLKPSVTQQGSRGKVKHSQAKVSGGAEGRKTEAHR